MPTWFKNLSAQAIHIEIFILSIPIILICPKQINKISKQHSVLPNAPPGMYHEALTANLFISYLWHTDQGFWITSHSTHIYNRQSC